MAATAAGTLTREAPAEVVKVKTVEREGLETFTAAEAETVDAIVARLIPTDANGPGATEARVGRYIDRALSGGLAFFRNDYTTGLAALDAYARTTAGAPFAQLTAAQQDAILTNVQNNTAPGFTPDSRSFFNLIRDHAVQGMFCDPYHGGNTNFVGWDLIGYPGVKIGAVTVQDQALDFTSVPAHRSGYDFAMFKKPAKSAKSKKGAMHHGN